jgi:hypothetical protein
MNSIIAALIFGVVLFFLMMIGIELSLRSFGKALTAFGNQAVRQFFEKLRIDRRDKSYRKPRFREHIRRINIMRYTLHFGIVLSAAFVLFRGAFPPGIWQITILLLFLLLAALDIFWRRMITGK